MRPGEVARTRLASAALALLTTIGMGSGCLAPAGAEALVASGFRTPRQAVASFQTFVRADLPLREYQCFSSAFRQRNGLSAFSYGEVRDELFRSQPWLKWIAKAEIEGELAVGEAEHWMDLRTLGRTVRVKLVREDFYEIRRGDELVASDDIDFERVLRLDPDGSGARLSLRLPIDVSPAEAAGTSEVLLARHWKLDDLHERADDEPPLGTARP